MNKHKVGACAVVGLLLAASCSGKSEPAVAPQNGTQRAPEPAQGGVPWPRPDNTAVLAARAGAPPDRKEYLSFHIHAHLDVFVNGRSVTVPAALGIEIRDPGVKSFKDPGKPTEYGGIERCKDPCISALHTHDESGVIHIEAKVPADYRLGQFFEVWNVSLTSSCVGGYCTPEAPIAVFVNGKQLRSDPAELVLKDGQEIAIVIGSPPKKIPEKYEDF